MDSAESGANRQPELFLTVSSIQRAIGDVEKRLSARFAIDHHLDRAALLDDEQLLGYRPRAGSPAAVDRSPLRLPARHRASLVEDLRHAQ